MKAGYQKHLLLAMAASLFLAPFPAGASAEVEANFLYNLSNFHNKFPFNDVKVRVDRARDEVYVLDGAVVRVFNDSGMEFYWFGDNPDLEGIQDLAVDEKGDLFLLSISYTNIAIPEYFLIRCNYRGDVKEKMKLTGLPPEYSRFSPISIFYQNGRLLFFSSRQMQVVVTDRTGLFQRGYDLADILEIDEKDRPKTEIYGFNLDSEGNMLLTVAVLFKAFVVSPDGKMVASFGKAGSAPGLFGIVSGIAKDDQGNYLVVERLRSVVMVFNKDLQFQKEFGYRGDKPWNLIRPNTVAVGNAGKLYVTQVRNQGVSVFSITNN